MLEHFDYTDTTYQYLPVSNESTSEKQMSTTKVGSYYLEDPDVKYYCNEVGTKLLIPRKYLFGSQTDHEYDSRKRRQVEEFLSSQGVDFLKENPVVVCALMDNLTDTTQFIIIDGHHRARYSSQEGIHELPSLVLDPPQLLTAANIFRRKYSQPELGLNQLIHQLSYDVSEALSSFRRLPDVKQPSLVNRLHTLEQLNEHFASF